MPTTNKHGTYSLVSHYFVYLCLLIKRQVKHQQAKGCSCKTTGWRGEAGKRLTEEIRPARPDAAPGNSKTPERKDSGHDCRTKQITLWRKRQDKPYSSLTVLIRDCSGKSIQAGTTDTRSRGERTSLTVLFQLHSLHIWGAKASTLFSSARTETTK